MAHTGKILHYNKYSAGVMQPYEGPVIAEAAIKLIVNGELLNTFICTPAELDYLAAGYLFNLGRIETKADIQSFEIDLPNNQIFIFHHEKTNQSGEYDPQKQMSADTAGRSVQEPVLEKIPANAPLALMEAFYVEQNRISQSSGLHSSAYANLGGIDLISEDLGRHNTLDKIAGKRLLDRPEYIPVVIITTGRISSDMVLKANRIGAPVLISRTTPTHAAVDAAINLGITIIGYTRSASYNIYTHKERILV